MTSRRAPAVLAGVALVAAAPLVAQYTTVHAFSGEAGAPQSPLLRTSDGRLYGTTSQGCLSGVGSVYALVPDGLGGYVHTDLACFTRSDPGHTPMGGVIEGADGALYGTASRGGTNDAGAVFRMTKSGELTFLYEFTGADGREPHGELVRATDGYFYGTTVFGGDHDDGTVYRLDTNGAFTSMHSFDGDDGMQPMAGLLEGADGALYGTTYLSAPVGTGGTVFRITKAGSLTTLHLFAYPIWLPKAPLIQLADGKLYGTTSWGTAFRGSPSLPDDFVPIANIPASNAGLEEGVDGFLYGTGDGSVFRLSPNNFNYQAIHAFSGIEGPPSTLIEMSDYGFIGTYPGTGALGFGGGAFVVYPWGQYQTLYQFQVAPRGRRPMGSIVEGPDGAVYGTTREGANRFGTVFRVGERGGHWLVHALDVFDGQEPETGLVSVGDGAFYGTTRFGGLSGGGTAFRVDRSGGFSLIHGFGASDGSPVSPLGVTSDGALLGATFDGGASDYGVLYRLQTDGQFDPLYTFTGSDGLLGYGRPLEGSDGELYGTAPWGGVNGYGFVFRWDSLNGFLNLYDFWQSPGLRPEAGLIEPAAGSFFGTTEGGGASFGGTVFHMDSEGTTDYLHDFGAGDGAAPHFELLAATDGKLYGVTMQEGANGLGTIFRIGSQGGFEKLHDFAASEGGPPGGPLIRGGDGALYGSLSEGGALGGGAIFRFAADTLLSIESLTPDSGPAVGGTAIVVTGTRFDATAAVSIGGTTVTASVDDAQHISTTSPGATPGSVGAVAISKSGGDSVALLDGWFADFLDVDGTHPLHDFVESIVRAGITAGCGGGNYCAGAPVTRAQMAAFLLKAEHGAAYAPPPCTGAFADVPCPSAFADWIEQLAAEGVTGGCGGANYCPGSPVTRAQMAVFLLKTLLGWSFTPPPAAGIFGDVPPASFAADWIEDLYRRQVTGGCSASPLLYCPSASNTRGQMAVFLTKTFTLP